MISLEFIQRTPDFKYTFQVHLRADTLSVIKVVGSLRLTYD